MESSVADSMQTPVRLVAPVPRAVEAREKIEQIRKQSGKLEPSEDACYVHRNPNDLECLADKGQVQHDFHVWKARMIPEDLRDTLDIEAYAATLAARTSYSQATIQKILLAMDLLVHELPRVWALQQRDWILSIDYLVAIAPVFDKLTVAEKEQVDPYVAYLLVPQFENQEWLGPRKLRALIDDLIHAVLELPVPVAIEGRKVDVRPTAAGNSAINAVVDPITGEVLEKAIATVQNAAPEPITKADALQQIVAGNVDVSVRVNTIRVDLGDGSLGPIFLPESGFLSQPDLETWAAVLRDGVDVTDIQDHVTLAYEFVPNQKLLATIRDETCRFPGCKRKASKCDMDHAVNHADGGPTSLKNNQRLCRSHHNMKTAGVFDYVPFDNGVAWYILPDGTTVTSLPTGYQRLRMRTVTNIRKHRLDAFKQELERQVEEVQSDIDMVEVEEKSLKIVGGVIGEGTPDGYYNRDEQEWKQLAFDDD